MQNEREVHLLIRLLERRFGTLSKEIQESFYPLDTETILDCIERLATVQYLEELLPEHPLSQEDDNRPKEFCSSTVVRTPKGLLISGTRLTLYDIMDYMKQCWSVDRIQKWFRLSDQQIIDISAYLDHHWAQVEAEYQQVIDYAEENQQFWKEKNRDLLNRMNSLQWGRQEFWTTLRQRQLQRKEE